MATLRFSRDIDIDADTAWRVLERYAEARSRLFDESRPVRMETLAEPRDDLPAGTYRVVTYDGVDVWELDLSVDAEHRRLAYTIPGFGGAAHHQASIQVEPRGDTTAHVTWITDVYPDAFVDLYPRELYEENFVHLAGALEKGDANTLS